LRKSFSLSIQWGEKRVGFTLPCSLLPLQKRGERERERGFCSFLKAWSDLRFFPSVIRRKGKKRRSFFVSFLSEGEEKKKKKRKPKPLCPTSFLRKKHLSFGCMGHPCQGGGRRERRLLLRKEKGEYFASKKVFAYIVHGGVHAHLTISGKKRGEEKYCVVF